ncbi:hypothetical protein Esti_003425 [Eimeria stiedai]
MRWAWGGWDWKRQGAPRLIVPPGLARQQERESLTEAELWGRCALCDPASLQLALYVPAAMPSPKALKPFRAKRGTGRHKGPTADGALFTLPHCINECSAMKRPRATAAAFAAAVAVLDRSPLVDALKQSQQVLARRVVVEGPPEGGPAPWQATVGSRKHTGRPRAAAKAAAANLHMKPLVERAPCPSRQQRTRRSGGPQPTCAGKQRGPQALQGPCLINVQGPSYRRPRKGPFSASLREGDLKAVKLLSDVSEGPPSCCLHLWKARSQLKR